MKAATYLLALALLAALGALWRTDSALGAERLAHQATKTEHAAAALKQSESARAAETQTALKESTHAADTSKNSDEFTTSQPVRDAIARADLAVAQRLRTDAERRAATYRAQAQSNAAACSNLADRHEAFDRHIVEGAGVVAEHRQALTRRDAEVKLLRGQIDADRELIDDGG